MNVLNAELGETSP